MEWVPHDEPTVQKQRGKWTVRQGGYDPSTGRRKVRQLGTFDTKRAATELAAALGISRVTARRYLEHLADTGQLLKQPRHGSRGRPEYEYRSA